MPSRRIEDLHPLMRPRVQAWLAACRDAGLDVLVYCTVRSWAEQAALYAQGRTAPGSIVTHARAGESAHNHALALDFVPLVAGKAQWAAPTPARPRPEWTQAVELAERAGLESASRWPRFREWPHLQMPAWRTLRQENAA